MTIGTELLLLEGTDGSEGEKEEKLFDSDEIWNCEEREHVGWRREDERAWVEMVKQFQLSYFVIDYRTSSLWTGEKGLNVTRRVEIFKILSPSDL